MLLDRYCYGQEARAGDGAGPARRWGLQAPRSNGNRAANHREQEEWEGCWRTRREPRSTRANQAEPPHMCDHAEPR